MNYIPVKIILEMIIRSPAMNTMSVQWGLVWNHIRVIVEAHGCRPQVGKLVLMEGFRHPAAAVSVINGLRRDSPIPWPTAANCGQLRHCGNSYRTHICT
jgi:hypothetical protein